MDDVAGANMSYKTAAFDQFGRLIEGTYCSDTEPFRDLVMRHGTDDQARMGTYVESLDSKIVEFARDADVLVIDGMYTEDEYLNGRLGFGHSSVSDAVTVGLSARCKRLYLYHHEPNHDDAAIDGMVSHARALVREHSSALEVFAAMEGEEVEF